MAKEVESGRKSAEVCSDREPGYLEREVVQPAGADVVLYLKSGRHYYARYEEVDGPASWSPPAAAGPSSTRPTTSPIASTPRATAAPARTGGRRSTRRGPGRRSSESGSWLLPAFNLPLAGVLGGVQVLLVFMLGLHLDGRHSSVGFGDLPRALWESPIAFLLIILTIVSFGAMIRLAHDATGASRLLIGLTHSTLQFVGLAVVIVVASRLSASLGDGVASLLAFLAIVWVLGGIGGVVGISGYLWATNCLGFHANEAYAPLHHADDKNFLRLHIDADGTLTRLPDRHRQGRAEVALLPRGRRRVAVAGAGRRRAGAPPHRGADRARHDENRRPERFDRPGGRTRR